MLGPPAKQAWVFPCPGSANEANKRVKLDDERLVYFMMRMTALDCPP